MNQAALTLRTISRAPDDPAAYLDWLTLTDAFEFLRQVADGDKLVVYACLRHAFLNTVLVPTTVATPPDYDDLLEWECDVSSSWVVGIGPAPTGISITPSMASARSRSLSGGEPLLFERHFEGLLGNKRYFELLQKFAHVSEIHWAPERHAYCRLDPRGDVEPCVEVFESDPITEDLAGTIVTCRRDLLDEYLTLTNMVAIRMFDFTRFRPGAFAGWSQASAPTIATEENLVSRSQTIPGHASYTRGVQILRSPFSNADLAARKSAAWFGEPERQYASFIAFDWKNDVVAEISTAPGRTANYFTNSDLPYELSPVFFRPDVLTKYKGDAEKYRLESRKLSCRGAWSLQAYDLNDAGQVHTYLVYLRQLPYEEQLYWQSFNEPPKGPISRRAYKRDFEGSWDVDLEPLERIQFLVRELVDEGVPYWTLRSKDLVDRVHVPITTSADEWADELMNLDKLVVEGFEEKWLRSTATKRGRTPEAQWRSLRLAVECLVGSGFEIDHARGLVAPLVTLHELRSKLKGHASDSEATEIRRKALRQHGSYKQHFLALCEECGEAIAELRQALRTKDQ